MCFAERLGMAPDDLIKLDANENPFGPSPRVIEALAKLAQYQRLSRSGIGPAARTCWPTTPAFPAEQILCGAGADELIELILQLFIEPGDWSSIPRRPSPCTVSTRRCITAEVIDVYRRADFSLDVAAIAAAVTRRASAKLVFLCSPNNPSGNLIAPADIQALARIARDHRG